MILFKPVESSYTLYTFFLWDLTFLAHDSQLKLCVRLLTGPLNYLKDPITLAYRNQPILTEPADRFFLLAHSILNIMSGSANFEM